jgi:hypothetical protein
VADVFRRNSIGGTANVAPSGDATLPRLILIRVCSVPSSPPKVTFLLIPGVTIVAAIAHHAESTIETPRMRLRAPKDFSRENCSLPWRRGHVPSHRTRAIAGDAYGRNARYYHVILSGG